MIKIVYDLKEHVLKETRLFISDLDGTLLTSEKKISHLTMEALRNFTSRGNHFAICTGRDICSARSVYDGLGLDFPGSYVIAYNGGLIYDVDNDKVIYRIGLDKGLVREIFDLAREYDIHVHTYNDDNILAREDNDCLKFYRRVIKTPPIVSDDIFPYLTVPPCKVICIELKDHAKQESFRLAAEKRFAGRVELMYSNEYYLELIPTGSGKGNALLRLCDILQIPREFAIASGDGDNDISMLEAAGLGIAMINAPDSVKCRADVVTDKDNNHDGLAPFLSFT
ncbi:MAG: Cof-type HAD-IIB family hydrolase [Eubacterium sp.]|nr:Cof-type HAD-IIB family hydrolase [Eubacterium sp.]